MPEDELKAKLKLVIERDKLNEKPFELLSDEEKNKLETLQNQIDQFTPEQKHAVNICINSCAESTAHFVIEAAFSQSIQFTGPVAIKKDLQPELTELFTPFLIPNDDEKKNLGIDNLAKTETNSETDSSLISQLNKLESNFLLTRVGKKGGTGHFIVLFKYKNDWLIFDPKSPKYKLLTEQKGTKLTDEGEDLLRKDFQAIPYTRKVLDKQIELILQHRADGKGRCEMKPYSNKNTDFRTLKTPLGIGNNEGTRTL